MVPDTDLHKLKSLSRAVRGGTLDALRLAERAYAMGSAACHVALSQSVTGPETLNLSELEKLAFQRAIEQTGSLLAAARVLGISKTSVYRKAKQFGFATGSLVCPNCHLPVHPRPACMPA